MKKLVLFLESAWPTCIVPSVARGAHATSRCALIAGIRAVCPGEMATVWPRKHDNPARNKVCSEFASLETARGSRSGKNLKCYIPTLF